MSIDNAALVRRGFDAFLRGDFDALREVLDPGTQWLWWEPIPGDASASSRRAWTSGSTTRISTAGPGRPSAISPAATS